MDLLEVRVLNPMYKDEVYAEICVPIFEFNNQTSGGVENELKRSNRRGMKTDEDTLAIIES